MNRDYRNAFLQLRCAQRTTVQQHLDIRMSQGAHETGQQFAERVLQMIEKEGLLRELESELRLFS